MIPFPRIVLVALIAMVLMAGALWAMDVNYIAWIGAWLSPNNQYHSGGAVFVILGLAITWFYTRYVGDRFFGPGFARGLAFGVFLAAISIWALPPILHALAGFKGNAQVVFEQRSRYQDPESLERPVRRQPPTRQVTPVEPTPWILGIEPPLKSVTANSNWASADAWRGRLLPFGLAFLLYGLVVGAFLSEKADSRK